MKYRLVCLALGLLASPAWAENGMEALQWLHRISMSAQTLNYKGTLVYQSGSRSEASRVVHVADDEGDMEQIEMLDGSPREVVRVGDEVRTWLPETRRLVVERRVPRPHFPLLLSTGLGELMDYYSIRRVAPDRVAGFETQPVVIEPRDSYRFRRQLWIDRKTGLLLKSETYSENGQLRESSTFTELHVGGVGDRNAIKARFGRNEAGWHLQDVRSNSSAEDQSQWKFRTVLPGFRRVAHMTRKTQPNLPEGAQLVFTDGLAAISVFVDPQANDAPQPAVGQFTAGALNVYKRMLGRNLVVLIGDVPASALKKFGDGIEAGKP